MRTCYLHLGMPKTGSSSIQAAFHGYDDGRLAYARLGGMNHGMPLATIFSRDPMRLPNVQWRETPEAEMHVKVRKTRKQFAKALSQRRDLLFSGEGIVDRLTPDEFGDLVAALRQRCDRIIAIAYVRPLATLTASQFQQRIKTGLRRFLLPAPDYRKRFQQVIDHVGVEATQFHRFDRSDLIGGDIVTDFASRLGLKAAPKQGVVTNESLSAETLGAIYAFNKYSGPLLRPALRTRLRHEIQEGLATAGQTRFGLSADLIERHQERHAADVAWMESVCGFDVKGRFVSVPDPVSNEATLLRFASRADREA